MVVESKLCNLLILHQRWDVDFYVMIVVLVEYQKASILLQIGFREAEDLSKIITQLKKQFYPNIDNIDLILWGRSMGAMTIIKFMGEKFAQTDYNNIQSIVLDSPFLSLRELIYEGAKNRFSIPKIFIDLVIRYLDPLIQEKVGLTIDDFQFLKIIKTTKCPLVLMASKNDGLIPQNHFRELYDIYKGKKTFFYLDQSHAQMRNQQTVQRVFKALQKNLLLEKNREKEAKYLKTFRSQLYMQPKSSHSCKKLSISSQQKSLMRSNSNIKRRNLVTLRLYTTHKKQNNPASEIRNGDLNGETQRVRQFEFNENEIKKALKPQNLQQMLIKKNTIEK